MGTLVSTGSITIADTNDGLSVFSASVYIVAASIPATPSGGSYNFTTKVVTPPSGWSSSIPTVTTTPVWISTFIFNTYDTSTPVTATTWSTPVKYSVAGNNGTNGSNGTNGTDGARGASKFYTTGSSWSDATALAAVVARFPSGVVVNDEVTISNGSTFAMTKYWNGSAWVAPGQVIDGNLLVTGSVSAAKVNTNGLTIRDPSGNIILDASGSGSLDWAKISGSGKPANNATVGADGSNLNIASSGNMFPNSDFSSPTHNWIIAWNASGTGTYNFTRDLAYPDWAPTGGHNLGVNRSGTTGAAANWFDIAYNQLIPVGQGQRIEISAYISSHRCSRYLMIYYYDINQTHIGDNWGLSVAGDIWFPQSTGDNGGPDLANWDRVGGILTMPTTTNSSATANVQYIKIAFRSSATTSNNPYSWITKIFLGIPKAGQTQLSPWSASTSSGAFAELSQLTPANASTYIASAAIGTAQIANASITNALIANAAIGSANIQNAAVGSAQIANASIGDAHITNLSAGKITTGTLAAGTSITVGTAVRGGSTMVSGKGQVLESSGAFSLGTPATNITFDGTNPIMVNGDIVGTTNIKNGAVTLIDTIRSSGTYQYTITSSTNGTEASLSIPTIVLPLTPVDIQINRTILFSFSMYTTDTLPGRIEVRIHTSDSAWSYTFCVMPSVKFAMNSWTVALPLTTGINQVTSAIVDVRLWNMSSTDGQWNAATPPYLWEWNLTSIAGKR